LFYMLTYAAICVGEGRVRLEIDSFSLQVLSGEKFRLFIDSNSRIVLWSSTNQLRVDSVMKFYSVWWIASTKLE
jgi:hypothetical protein